MERIIYDDDGYTFEETKNQMFEERDIRFEDFEWNKADDIPDEMVYDEISALQEIWWRDEEFEMEKFFNSSTYILQGSFGTWRGREAGGFTFCSFKELERTWSGNYQKTVKIFDKNGEFNISISHHDGTNHFIVRELTEKGVKYLERHSYMSLEELHNKLMCCPYSRNIHYADKIFGKISKIA